MTDDSTVSTYENRLNSWRDEAVVGLKKKVVLEAGTMFHPDFKGI